MTFVRVPPADDLLEGEMTGCNVDGVAVLIVKGRGYVAAYEDRCAHLGVRLSEGKLEGDRITCKVHLWEYDARSGCGVNPARARLISLPVRLEGEALLVDVGARSAGTIVPAAGPGDRVGPVLEANEIGRAIVAAIQRTNADVLVQDRGSYLRVLSRTRCVLQRSAIEGELGRPFSIPGDLEQVMPSFKGSLTMTSDEASWSLGGKP